MDITSIPFVKKVGIHKNQFGNLELKFNHDVQNHLKTVHASAQFTLAETASGEILYVLFPELAVKVIPVMRESKIKYKNPATKDIIAYPTVSEQARLAFKEQLDKKGRASIIVNVEIRDVDDTLICSGDFKWFIQII